MTYKDLENKINQNKIAIRYNIVVEGAAIKPEEYPEVKEGLPTEEPFKSIALGVLYEDKAKVLSDVKESLENEISPLDIINKGLMKGIDAVSLHKRSLFLTLFNACRRCNDGKCKRM